MSRLLLAVMLALTTPTLSAQSSILEQMASPEGSFDASLFTPPDTIPFKVYQRKTAEGEVQSWTNVSYVPVGLLDEVTETILNIPERALTAAISAAQSTGCRAVGNGSITVSFDIDVASERVIIGIGSGLSVTFDCKNGVAL